MKWYRQLYLSEKAREQRKTMIKKFKDGALHPRLYVIALPSNKENLLDILPQPVLLQEHYKKAGISVVGIACSKQEAMELSGMIVMDAYRATGSTDVESYLGDDFGSVPEEGFDGKERYREW
ncbi:hypothetical protein [Qiania dongpingensis]|uniref:Uncharacterized protein n=1 Tax=Qiania dongpingensis TaxID=2763669 RepID=A0A7G9G509_9FIRM|nr:hypothetical protein [Qiania dongpingensis]QNM05891.1 hypothetical protein H9Q78_01570 [Qiania dongpingensis]